MSSSPDREPRDEADDRAEDAPPEEGREDANDEEPVAEAANGRSKVDRSPSPRERSLSPARADSMDKSPVRYRVRLLCLLGLASSLCANVCEVVIMPFHCFMLKCLR